VDALVLVGFSALVIALAATQDRSTVARGVLWVVWLGVVLGYEPLLVSRRGATVGHAAMNLCVLDNRTDRYLPFRRALVRAWLKGLLGLVSFFSMNFSRRHQAVHDILTGSSVRIRDAARARPHQYWARAPDGPGAA
jgi:uncharacterized RDD family membrane protein YckC